MDLLTSVWVPLGSALLGGVLSLVGALVALHRSHKLELLRSEATEKKNAAEKAYSAFHKLHNVYETAANLSRQIDERFEQALRAGAGDLEPWAKVPAFVGSDYQEEAITPDETTFLIAAGNADLLNDIHIIQQRVWNITGSVKKYNELWEAMNSFFVENLDEGSIADGTRMSASFSGKLGFIASAKEHQLQNLLGQIMELLALDTDESLRVLLCYKAACENHFGDLFPKFNFEKAEIC
ncbi:MAG: hypothetical protein GYB25_10525 [Rhodobacteraceae bacterium]|nr:hypothetical protein [Paracoccaceae bacterium]